MPPNFLGRMRIFGLLSKLTEASSLVTENMLEDYKQGLVSAETRRDNNE